MARITTLVSDLSGKQIESEKDSVQITVKYGDARKGQYIIDAHPDDPVVKTLTDKGTQQARRGRKPKAQSEAS